MWLWITFQTNRTQEWLNLLQCFYNEVTIITCPYQVVACILLQYIWLSFNPYKPIHISNEFAWIRDNIYTLCVASIESLMVRKLWTTLHLCSQLALRPQVNIIKLQRIGAKIIGHEKSCLQPYTYSCWACMSLVSI